MDVLHRPRRTARPTRAPFAALALTVAVLATGATPAGAVIEQVKEGAETVEVGVHTRQPPAAELKPLQYHGGLVDPASYTYAIYWDPAEEYHSDWLRTIDGYLHDVGASSGELDTVFALNSQYTGPASSRASYRSTFRGAYTDTFAYPTNGCAQPTGQPTCLTDAQIRTELARFIANEHLPTGREIIYFVLTPPAVTVCLEGGATNNCSTSAKEHKEEEVVGGANKAGALAEATGFCGYHSVIEPASESPIVYGVQPWVAGHAGHVIKEIPLATLSPTAAELACQNRGTLVEPDQATSFIHFDSYETGLSDLIINDLSLQQSDIVVDPLFDGWYQTATNAEQGDMCQGVFSPIQVEPKEEKLEGTQALNLSNQTLNGHSYYLQYAYSSVGVTAHQTNVCWEGVELVPHFTATNVVGDADTVAFDALESGITLDANPRELKLDEPYTVPLYKWEFGDGTSTGTSTQASILHSYQYAGNYQVTLTVTDSGGYVRSATNTIPVAGAPRPSSATGGGSGGGSSAGVLAPPPAPPAQSRGTAPTVKDFVESTSLKKVLRSGLAVRYTVNQQVAGSVQVLLDADTAKRLGIRGPAATGLPKGTPRLIVIGSAVLVTTKAGSGTVRLKLSRTTTQRLAHINSLKVTLRLLVRNAARQGAQTTTALSTVTLSK